MKVLVLGLGSIGQRHCRILRSILKDELELYTFRQRNLQIVINDNMTAEEGKDPLAHYQINACRSMDEALDTKPDAVFITNPISMHVETAITAAERGIPFFIEKPLGNSLDGLDHLSKLVQDQNLATFVGYQMRFHPGLALIKKMLDGQELGNIYYADIHFGEWLPGMHPYEDYRESHAARQDQGGGVILCLSHEVDTAYWLFGYPKRVMTMGGHISELELSVEDTADIMMECDRYGKPFPVHIHLDFLQKPPKRYCYIVGEKGALSWNYYDGSVYFHKRGEQEPTVTSFDGFVRNSMFLGEVGQFIDAVQKKAEPSIPLQEGINTLKICLAAKQSLESHESITL